MMNNRLLIITILLASSLTACNKQKKFLNRMVGTWNIVEERSQRINSDGTIDQVENSTDVGELILSEPSFSADIFMDYSIFFTASGFSLRDRAFKTDEDRKRVFFYNFFCDDLFGCDWAGTIEEDEPARQVWTFYRRTSGANGGSAHRKITWTLEKE